MTYLIPVRFFKDVLTQISPVLRPPYKVYLPDTQESANVSVVS